MPASPDCPLALACNLAPIHNLAPAFCPKILGVGRDLWMVLNHSVNAGLVVGTLGGGGHP